MSSRTVAIIGVCIVLAASVYLGVRLMNQPAPSTASAPAACPLTPTPAASATAAAANPGAPGRPALQGGSSTSGAANAAIAAGIAFLEKAQAPDGTWAKGNFGISALCTEALLAAGRPATDPTVARALAHLLQFQKEDGGIYDDTGLRIYSTSLALEALIRADPTKYADPIRKAAAFIEKNQWGADESIEKSDPKFGGWGYGKNNRPDMSNSGFAADAYHALQQAGVPENSEVWKRLEVFASRCQDRSESNDGAFKGVDSGGGIYSPLESKAEMITLPDGTKVFRTYGSMTYSLLKCMVFAGLKRDDPRIVAAVDWLRKHWTFEENPELGQQGLYYYYMTASRALSAWGEATITDPRQRPHDWRRELTEAIAKRQRPDGSWINAADRWFEGDPTVPTSYALMALAECAK